MINKSHGTIQCMEGKFTKGYKFTGYILIAFFVFYYIQELYYRYFFYHLDGALDWSVYNQALQLINWNDLNPYLPIRGLRIFNDHFDPIIIPFALTFAKVFPPALVMVTVEIFFIVASAWLVYWYAQKKNFSPSATLLMVMYLLFNNGVIQGLFFPSHPTVWSAFAFVCLCIAWMKGKFKWVLASLVFLYTFKEEFPLVGFMVAVTYGLKKQWREGVITFILTAVWFWFTQNRSLFFDGYHMNYNNPVFYGVTHPAVFPNEGVIGLFKKWTNLFLSLLLLFAPILYLMKKKAFQWEKSSLEILFFSIPLFAVRFFYHGGVFELQYLSQITALWGMALFLSIKNAYFSCRFLLVYFLILFAFNNVAYVSGGDLKWFSLFKHWRVSELLNLSKNDTEKSPLFERKKAFGEAITYFDDMGDKVNIFTQDPLNIHFTKNRHVYDDWSGWKDKKNIGEVFLDRDEQVRPRPGNWNYLVLEKSDFDTKNPFIKNFMEGAEVVMDNEYVIVAKKPPLKIEK